jgi:hypothetical protein
MKIAILTCFGALLLAGCVSKREVVYTEPSVTRTTVIHEPAGTVRVYEPGVRYYDSGVRYYRAPMHPRKLGEYHQSQYSYYH